MYDVSSLVSPTVLGSLIAGVITAVVSVAVAILAKRVPSIDRNHVKRLAVIDLAKKRLELRDQVLKLELSAAEQDADAQEEARRKAQRATKRIIADANQFMKRLEWKSEITRVLTRKDHNLTTKRLGWGEHVSYWTLIAASWLFRGIGVLILFDVFLKWVPVASKAGPQWTAITLHTIGGMFIGFAFLLIGVKYLRMSKEAQYPKPDAPILDEV